MTYDLAFVESALKEWRKLAPPIRAQFKKKLAERLEHPHVPSTLLHNLPDCYKIKLRTIGYRLVYQVKSMARSCWSRRLPSASETRMRSTLRQHAEPRGSG